MCSSITCFLWGEPHPPRPRRYRYQMLYVVRDFDLMLFLEEALKAEDCFVDYVPDFEMSCLFLTSREIRFDLLLPEEEIRGGRGLDLVRLARSLEQSRRMPVILLSDRDRAAQARAVGANAFFRKPVQPSALFETMRRLLKHL